MGRQITLDDLQDELETLLDADDAALAIDVIEKHLVNGDRIKVNLAPPTGVKSLDRVLYQVGDDDPTPPRPPWCMAQVSQPGLWDYCTWPPGHRGPHVSGASGKINAVFDRDKVSGWHEYAGLTDEQIAARRALAEIADERDDDPPPSETRPRVESALEGTRLARDAEALRDRVRAADRDAMSPSRSELTALMVMITDLLVAVTEKVEK